MSLHARSRAVRSALALLAAGLVLATLTTPASAGNTQPTRPDGLMLRGSGTWVADGASGGTATAPVQFWLPKSVEPDAAQATATMHADDGALPGPEQCETGTATIVTTGDRQVSVTLEATGRICGSFVEDPSMQPIWRFGGRFVVTGGFPRHRGVDGLAQVELYPDGGAWVFATDS